MKRYQFPAKALLCALLAVTAVAPAHAASPDAWDEFRAEVTQACREMASRSYDVIDAVTDPFGSEDYGLSVLRVRERGDDAARMVVCVFSKETGRIQLGTAVEAAPAGSTEDGAGSVQ